MKTRNSFSTLRWVSLFFIVAAVILVTLQLVSFSRVRATFPDGQKIAGVPVGGLDHQQAAQLISQYYALPVEVHYGNAVIQVKPSTVGFELDLESMLTAADVQRTDQSFWSGFWNHLWNREETPSEVPLASTISDDRLRSYLQTEIAARYDQPPSAALPVPGSVSFQPGQSGTTLDIDRAMTLIKDALNSPTARVVNLSVKKTTALRPSLQNLQILLQQIVDMNKFDGLIDVYIQDLQTYQELHFAYEAGTNPSVDPDIAFTAASTIKIPILVSIMRRVSNPPPDEVAQLLGLVFGESDNAATDRVVQLVIDPNRGPLDVSKDMQTLGLQNTFWAGFFYDGAPLLNLFNTPANQRTDINTGPDVYNQTTAADMGMLLSDIYQCAETGGGTLVAAFGDQFDQAKCQQVVNYMLGDHIGVLLQAGLPDGTKFAHKHGWITESDGLIHTMGDAGIVYSPGGNYVVTLYMHQAVQLLFDPANELAAQLSTAIYNYFNTPTQ